MEELTMERVSVVNQKGGVGKTSVSFNLGFALRQLGRRVLLVDNDPQSSLSQGLLGPAATFAAAEDDTIAAIYKGADPAAVVVRPICVGLDLLMGQVKGTRFNVPEPWMIPRDEQLALREFCDYHAGRWDVVILDGPPNLQLCTWTNLLASTSVVVVLQPEDFGVQGLREVSHMIHLARSGTNPGLRLLGYLVNMAERKRVHASYLTELRAVYGPEVFETVIPRAADFPEGLVHQRSVVEFKPQGKGAAAIRALAGEFLARAGLEGTCHGEVA
jgi:chromosome partitioning protein